MDRTNSEKAINLLYKIDDLSFSADNMQKILKEIRTTDGSKAKFIVSSEKGTNTTEVSKKTSEKICQVILQRYYDLIKEAKSELDMIIDNTMV